MNRQREQLHGHDLNLDQTIRPGSVAEIATFLREATALGTPVVPIGGGTSLGTGNATSHAFTGIDMRSLTGVREYQPTDLTASFHAGTSLWDVIAILGEHGQELPLDLPRAAEGTIGGLVATGFSGPRRLSSGTMKDLIIGCDYVRGDGLAAKAGGMLVKNVSGYEIPRFLHGSWGALAVLTSVNVKVVPRPKADATLRLRYERAEHALDPQERLLTGKATIAAAVSERREGGWTLKVRLLGRSAALEEQMRALRHELGGDAEVIDSGAPWYDFDERWATTGDDVRLVIGAPGSVLRRIAGEVAGWDVAGDMAVSLGTGSLRMRLDPSATTIGDVSARLGTLASSGRGGTWLIESAPPEWKANTSVWGPDHDGLSLMRDLKREFDPAGILNRGRLFIQESV